jgi:hypothetical protein
MTADEARKFFRDPGVFNVKTTGCLGNGVANDTSAFGDTIGAAGNYAAANGNATVYVPGGYYNLNELPDITSSGGLSIIGAGSRSSFLNFVPTADNQRLMRFNRSGGVQGLGHSLQNLTFHTTNTTYSKTALELADVGTMSIQNVNIFNWFGNNTNSIGLRTRGRDNLWVTNFLSNAVVPLYISKNANDNTGDYAADHFNFTNCYLQVPTGQAPPNAAFEGGPALKSACVMVEPGAQVTEMQFGGSQAWVGGKYGLHWVQTVGRNGTKVMLRNVRTEQGTDPDAWSIMMDLGAYLAAGQMDILLMDACYLDGARNGYYTRNVHTITARDTGLKQVPGRTICDVGNALSMDWENVNTVYNIEAGAVITDSNLYFIEATPHSQSYTFPSSARWRRRSTAANYGEYPSRKMSAHKWYWAGQIATGAAIQLPVNVGNEWEVAKISVVATTVTSNSIEYGDWFASQRAVGHKGIVKGSASAQTSNTNEASKLCVYCESSGGATTNPLVAPVYVKNNLAETVWAVIEVVGKRSIET